MQSDMSLIVCVDPRLKPLRAAQLQSKGVKISVIDYKDPASLKQALEGVEVVVSTLAGGGLPLQHALADGAKAAGVKLFVPS